MIFLFDFETTGLSESAAPIQIAALILDDNLVEVESYSTFIRPVEGCELHPVAMAMHAEKGRTLEMLLRYGEAGGRVFARIAEMISRHATSGRRVTPAGHNVIGFDLPILRREFDRYGIHNVPLDHQALDTMCLAFGLLKFKGKVPNVKLETLAKHYGIEEFTGDGAHDAVSDVRVTAEVLKRLLA